MGRILENKMTKTRNYRIISGTIILAGVMSVTLAGCKPPAPPSADNVLGGTIVEVQLADGTRCAVWDGFKAGGISCDWK